MKKLGAIETSIIGFLIGVIVAAYTTFKIGTDGFVGNILNWISLRSVFNYLNLPENQTLVGFFIFTVIVFALYGLFLGLILKTLHSSKLIIVPLVLLLAFTLFEKCLIVQFHSL